MSDDLTARIGEVLDRHDHEQRRNNVTVEILQPGHPMLRLLAEARDEITRLNAHVEQLLNACDAADETISMQAAQAERLRALLDAPSTASPVRDGTNTEQEQQ